MCAAHPLVSVITPTYNRADLLAEAISSVLQQSYRDLELIIVDNGSTDHTRTIVDSFRDPRIRYFYQGNSGSPVSPRNRGFSKARGDIICTLDSDDVWLPEKLCLQVAEFLRCPSVGLVYTDCFLMDGSGRIRGLYSDYHPPHQGDVLEALLRCNFIPAVTVAMRKRLLDEFGPQNEAYLIAHDLELYLKIANAYPVAYISQPLAKLRVHNVSLTRSRIMNRLEVLQVVKPWCRGEVHSRLSQGVRNRIWAYWCFLTGLEMLGTNDNQNEGRCWMKEAVRDHPGHILYWAGLALAFAPRSVVGKTVDLAKRRWSIERILTT